MKQCIGRLFVVVILFTLLISSPTSNTVLASPQISDIVYTESELTNWCKTHKDSGGEVLLGDNIVIKNGINIFGENKKIVINTGKYGLIFDGDYISMHDFEIIGEGIHHPVVEVKNVGGWYTHWLNVVYEMHITATGENDIGGIALKISEEDMDSVQLTNMENEGSIKSYGDGAIGVYLSVPQDLYCLKVYSTGKNSAAIYSEHPVNIYYSKLYSYGQRANTVAGNKKISLYSCYSDPNPTNINSTRYSISDVVGRSFYQPIKQYSNSLGYYDNYYTFKMTSEDKSSYYYETFALEWDISFQNIDNNVLGVTKTSGKLCPIFQGLGLEPAASFEMIYDVRDPKVPCINELEFHDNNDVKYARLNFWESYDPDDKKVILWRSDDEGKTWYDFTDSPSLEWKDDQLFFYYDNLKKSTTLQLEVPGLGESNLVVLNVNDGIVGGGLGGDRTGTDRVIKKDEEIPSSTDPANPYIQYDEKKIEDNSKNETTYKHHTFHKNLNENKIDGNIINLNQSTEKSKPTEIDSVQAESNDNKENLSQPVTQHAKSNLLIFSGISVALLCSIIFLVLYVINKRRSLKDC